MSRRIKLMESVQRFRCIGGFFVASLLLCLARGAFAADELGCEKLDLRPCVSTKGCFLDCESKDPNRCFPYHCRAARGECEGTVSQWSLTKEICDSLGDCVFSPAFCFCPGPENCMCGGGPPPRCVKR